MRYTKKFKEDIVTSYSKGESVHVSLSIGPSVSMIYSWIKNSVGIVWVTGLNKAIKEQEKKISRFENMIKIIQNADFFKNVSLSKRLKIIDEVWEKYGINASCDALDVARGTFNNHQKQGKGRNYLHKKHKKELLPEIQKIDQEFHHIYGANKITAEL